jgi:hypothetical protein
MVLIQNHWVILEQEELSILKRQNVSRSLSFGLTSVKDTAEEQENACTTNIHNMDEQWIDDLLGYESKGIVRLSTKQVYFSMLGLNHHGYLWQWPKNASYYSSKIQLPTFLHFTSHQSLFTTI